jgi:fatty-acyl-CoA synthase
LSGINIAAAIVAWGRISPSRVAIEFGADVWTYARLAANVDRWASRFHAAGLRAGTVVLVFLPQSAESIAIYFGLMRCGAIPSFMPLPSPKQDPNYYWVSHQRLLGVIRPAALVTEAEHRLAMRAAGFDGLVAHIFAPDDAWPEPSVEGVFADASDDDLALLQHSSGTTSLKKGVMLSHRAIGQQIEAYRRALNASADDVVVSWLPLYHDMGLIACTVMPLVLGQMLVLLDPFQWVGDPRSLLSAIDRHRGSLVWLPNFAFELLAKVVRYDPGSLDLSCVRAFIDCSEPCKPASFDRFVDRFAAAGVHQGQLQVCYAMAETVFAVTQTRLGESVERLRVDAVSLSVDRLVAPPRDGATALVLLSAGRPVDGMEVRVIDNEGKPLGEGQVGEIELVSGFLFDGYFNRPEVTAGRLCNGRYRTNDLGFVRGGELYVLGRADDLIIVHGRNYFAHEVEAVANEVPGLKAGRNVAIGVFNEMLGTQDIVLIAEASGRVEGVDAIALKRAVKHEVQERMALDLREVKLVDVDWLVKTTSGKLSRTLNREKYLSTLASGRRTEATGGGEDVR